MSHITTQYLLLKLSMCEKLKHCYIDCVCYTGEEVWKKVEHLRDERKKI